MSGRTYTLVDAQRNLWNWTCRVCGVTNRVRAVNEPKKPCIHCEGNSERVDTLMTADELRKMLDRFHASLQEVSVWVLMRDPQIEDHPSGLADLDQVWRDLSNHCALMKDAEQPLPDPPSWPAGVIPQDSEASTVRMPTLADANAELIGKLQARVCQLEGEAKSRDERLRKVESAIDVLGVGKLARPSKRMARLVEAAKAAGIEARVWSTDVAVLADGSVPGHSHSDSGERCPPFHDEGCWEGDSCIKCRHCHKWIRPENMGQDCVQAPSAPLRPCGHCGSMDITVSRNEPIRCGKCDAVIDV